MGYLKERIDNMELSQVLAKIEGLVLRGDINREVTSIEYDSRHVTSGSMFVAVKGFKTDGHEYINAAIQNGATTVAIEDGMYDVESIPKNVNVVISKDTRNLLALSACNFYSHPSREFKLVGVTGTKGKTTTTYMIKAILEKERYRYSYGRAFKMDLIKSTFIKLPTKNNLPDWEFMENYIKSLPYGDRI